MKNILTSVILRAGKLLNTNTYIVLPFTTFLVGHQEIIRLTNRNSEMQAHLTPEQFRETYQRTPFFVRSLYQSSAHIRSMHIYF